MNPTHRWLITYSEYDEYPSGEPHFPDAFREYVGTLEQLVAYILQEETSHQKGRLLYQRRWLQTPPDGISEAEWSALGIPRPHDSGRVWCRKVAEILPVPDVFLSEIRSQAKRDAVIKLEEDIEAAREKLRMKEARKAAAIEQEEKEQLVRLLVKYPTTFL